MAVLWLAIVLLLILGASRAARLLPSRLRPASVQAGQTPPDSLTLRGSLALDLRRRVHLVEAAGQPMLILTGGTADVMVALRQPQD